jgi:hypothetical protein
VQEGAPASEVCRPWLLLLLALVTRIRNARSDGTSPTSAPKMRAPLIRLARLATFPPRGEGGFFPGLPRPGAVQGRELPSEVRCSSGISSGLDFAFVKTYIG